MTLSFVTDSVCHAPDGVGWGVTWDFGMAAHSASEVFGEGSRLVAGQVVEVAASGPPLFYSAAVLACFVVLVLVLWAYRDCVPGVFNIVRGGVFAEKLLDKHNKLFSACLDWAVGLGGFALGLACWRMTGARMWAVVPGLWAAAAAIWGVQWLILVVAGRLTLYTEFTARLFYLRKIMAAAGAILLLPLFLLYAASQVRALGLALLVGVLLLLILLIIRTFMLFVRQRFSILLWILYLCAVEILPVNVAVIVAGKLLW